MNLPSRQALTSAAVMLAVLIFAGCRATHLSNVKKDSTYDSTKMRRVFVVAAVKTERVQKMLEDEFVRQLNAKNKEAIPSYTMVSRDRQMDHETWKKLISDNRFDTVIVSRLTEMQVEEKEFGMKYNDPTYASGYALYNYGSMYQPSTYVREQTAYLETSVFDMASGKDVWSARSKTEIAWGGDPVPQIRRFVQLLFKEARKK